MIYCMICFSHHIIFLRFMFCNVNIINEATNLVVHIVFKYKVIHYAVGLVFQCNSSLTYCAAYYNNTTNRMRFIIRAIVRVTYDVSVKVYRCIYLQPPSIMVNLFAISLR